MTEAVTSGHEPLAPQAEAFANAVDDKFNEAHGREDEIGATWMQRPGEEGLHVKPNAELKELLELSDTSELFLIRTKPEQADEPVLAGPRLDVFVPAEEGAGINYTAYRIDDSQLVRLAYESTDLSKRETKAEDGFGAVPFLRPVAERLRLGGNSGVLQEVVNRLTAGEQLEQTPVDSHFGDQLIVGITASEVQTENAFKRQVIERETAQAQRPIGHSGIAA